MGSKKEIEFTKRIPVSPEIEDYCDRVRKSINDLENVISSDFPLVAKETTVPHNFFQDAWYSYQQRLTETIETGKLMQSGMMLPDGTIYTNQIPGFLRYLAQFGIVGISQSVLSRDNQSKLGIFLKRTEGPNFLGVVSFCENNIGYSGFVPTKLSDKDFFHEPVYHLSSPNFGIGCNFVSVRLYSEIRDGNAIRIDRFGEKGIEFP